MKIINNITEKLADDLRITIEPGSRVSVAAACFSVYAFEELRTQLERVSELRFIFTSPAFLEERPERAQREFYIPRLTREKALHGSEFEIRLRNDLSQKAISRECAQWIRQKALFRSNCTAEGMPGFLAVEGREQTAYAPISGFTRAELGCERGGDLFSMINRIDAPESQAYIKLPKAFFISTPVGKYSPDWAIAFHEGEVRHVYFVAETKGSNDTLELRGVESAKIECARAHFAAISNSGVTYGVVESFDQLLELVI